MTDTPEVKPDADGAIPAGGEAPPTDAAQPDFTPSPRPKKGGYIVTAWLVIILGLGYGALLAGVHVGLKEKIEANKTAETIAQLPVLMQSILPEGTKAEDVHGEKDEALNAWVVTVGDEVIGYVLPAIGQGFADKIELLVGVDAAVTNLTGMYVLDQKETPGLGDFIRGEDFRSQFAAAPADVELEAAKQNADPAAGRIQALTGATISSQSVCNIINAAVADFRARLAADNTGEGE